VGDACLLKKTGLPDFVGEFEALVVVGKNMTTVFPGHGVERFPAPLGKDDSRG